MLCGCECHEHLSRDLTVHVYMFPVSEACCFIVNLSNVCQSAIKPGQAADNVGDSTIPWLLLLGDSKRSTSGDLGDRSYACMLVKNTLKCGHNDNIPFKSKYRSRYIIHSSHFM